MTPLQAGMIVAAVAASIGGLAGGATVARLTDTTRAPAPVYQVVPPVPSRYHFEREADVIAAWCRRGGQTHDTPRFTITCKAP